MHATLAVLVASSLSAVIFAQEPIAPASQRVAQLAAAPASIPVPDGPVVKRAELEGGLIIEDIKIGQGYEVKPGGAVVAHYQGTLKDGGKVFDSSFQRGEPIAFPMSSVIAGWGKGVPGMRIGGVRRLIIPAKLAYGEKAVGDVIPANSDLVFIVQLVDALQVEDTKVGEGEAAGPNCVGVIAYTMKDSTGKVIEKADASKPYIWVTGQFQPVQFGLEGMKAGGKRTLVVPKEMNFAVPGGGETRRPQNGPVTMEIELIAVRNPSLKTPGDGC